MSNSELGREGPLSGVWTNAAYLAFVNFSNYVVPLLYIPFLLRTIGQERYGALMFAQALVYYLVVLVDFGFNYSATRRIALARHDHAVLRAEFSANILAKFVLVGVAVCFALAMLTFSARVRLEGGLFILWMGLVINSALLPSWFFQGMEMMRTMTLIHVSGRIAALLGLVLFVKSPADDGIAAAVLAGFPAFAGAVGLALALTRYRMTMFGASWDLVVRSLRRSANLFVTTLSTNLYTITITVILGFVVSNSVVSAYAVADKCARACGQLISPLSASVYPRITKLVGMVSADVAARAALRSGAFIIAIGALGTAILLVASPLIVGFFLGHKDAIVLELMHITAFLPVVISVGNVFGVQILMAFGVTRDLVRWQFAVAVIGLPLTYFLVRAAAAKGAAWSALMLEMFISVGFTCLAYRKVLSGRSAFRAQVKFRETE